MLPAYFSTAPGRNFSGHRTSRNISVNTLHPPPGTSGGRWLCCCRGGPVDDEGDDDDDEGSLGLGVRPLDQRPRCWSRRSLGERELISQSSIIVVLSSTSTVVALWWLWRSCRCWFSLGQPPGLALLSRRGGERRWRCPASSCPRYSCRRPFRWSHDGDYLEAVGSADKVHVMRCCRGYDIDLNSSSLAGSGGGFWAGGSITAAKALLRFATIDRSRWTHWSPLGCKTGSKGLSLKIEGLFDTTLAPAPPLLELELSQSISAPLKLGVELGGALSQNVLELWS